MFLLPRMSFLSSFQPSELLLIPQSPAHMAPPSVDGETRPERASDLLLHATQSSGCRHEINKNQLSVSTYCTKTLKILSGCVRSQHGKSQERILS